MRRMRVRYQAAVLLVAVALCVFPVSQAYAGQGMRAGQDLGAGVTAIAANVVYIPAKLIYAGLGATTGVLAFVLTLGSRQTANDIWVPSLGGDYILTSEMISGRRSFQFRGRGDPEL